MTAGILRAARVWPLIGMLVIALAGCSATLTQTTPPATTPSASTSPGGEPRLSGSIVVDAAASLTDVFQKLGDEFRTANPGVTVTFNLGGSSALAEQINSGAPADVFAAASPATMATVTDAGGASGKPTVFVRNRLEIAIPPSNPGHVTGLADLANPSKTIALCAAEVPCGAAAARVFAAAGLTPAPDTLEQDVKAALTKVELGEVDAALVYRTDVIAAGGRVKGIAFPEADHAISDYLVAPLKNSGNSRVAAAFVSWILSAKGRAVLAAAGFDLP
ncbi:MAG: molybdate ABC transporter substrate-binding protein [Lacisediminihabitans sp.]